MELIEKIQNTQNIQKEAFEELEMVLSAKPEELVDDKPRKNLNSSTEKVSSPERKFNQSGDKKLNSSNEKK